MDFQLVYPIGLEQELKAGRAVLIDIRDRADFRKDHWPGAVNYSYDEIEKGHVRLPKNRKLVLYCEHGGGSMQLARSLGRQGYQVATVVGGYEAMKKLK
ncbi:MAG: rhodanese-like domain-containing protein [Agathobacter sp.]|nr:rhodanese-like domain-containing protein [Agathobacter sp.]